MPASGAARGGLHVRVVCDEPRMDQLASAHSGRDAEVWRDDCVELFVATPRLRRYAHFAVNPAGGLFDELGRDARWNAEWQAEATRGETSWRVDFLLPWKALGGSPEAEETWRLNVCRSRRPVSELSCWSPTGSGFHAPDRFGQIRFGEGPVPTALAWHLPSATRGEIRSVWSPAEPPPVLLVNGQPAEKGFAIGQEGIVPLWLEVRRGEEAVYRTLRVVQLAPLRTLLAEVDRRLGAIPSHPALDPEVRALRAEFAAVRELAAVAPPSASERVERMLGQLRLRASHLAVRGRLLADKAPADGIAYGIETPLRKLLRHEPFTGQPGGTVAFDAGRNEMAAAQVVLFAFADPLLMVRAEWGDAKAESGAVLPASALRVRRVGYVHTCKPVYRVDYTGVWPDPLMEATPFDVQPQGFETLWVDVRVPTDAVPGVYRGELRLVARNARPTAVPVEIRVRGFTIPARPSLSTAFGLGPNWRVPQDRDAYVRNYLEHRISPYSAAPSPTLEKPPLLDWRAARELRVRATADTACALLVTVVPEDGEPLTLGPEPVVPGRETSAVLDLRSFGQPVREWRASLAGAARGTLTAELAGADGAVRGLCADATAAQRVGADGWIEEWPTWSGTGWDDPQIPAVWDWTAFDGALDTYLPLGLAAHRAPLRQPYGGWARALQEHLAASGRLEMFYTYLFDEPTPERYPLLNRVLGEVKRSAPQVKNMMTARHFPPELKYVDIWCPEAYSFDPAAAKAEQERGREVWWYVAFSTRHPFPNVWIDYPALDCRVWPWMTWKHDLDGMLYWSGTAWSRNDPWRTGETFHDSNGDGSLLYPGDDGKPVDSIRWECLRDGLEDYEILCLLEAGSSELRAAARAPELVRRAETLCAIEDGVVRSFRDYNGDPAALLAARREMSDVLEAIVGELGREPAIQGRPRRRSGVDLAAIPADDPASATMSGVASVVLPPPQPETGLMLRYAFDTDAPFACDLSGMGRHGRVRGARREKGTLVLGDKGGVRLPGGLELLGATATEGTVALWARPDFDPSSLSNKLFEGYATLFYFMETDGNGLPDGYDEIGLFLHGPKLLARCGGRPSLFASIDTPFVKGRWTHVAITWTQGDRRLYVDGKAAAVVKGEFPPARLDGFPATLGCHSPRMGWPWQGALDEFRVYRRALAPAEIRRLAASPAPGDK